VEGKLSKPLTNKIYFIHHSLTRAVRRDFRRQFWSCRYTHDCWSILLSCEKIELWSYQGRLYH